MPRLLNRLHGTVVDVPGEVGEPADLETRRLIRNTLCPLPRHDCPCSEADGTYDSPIVVAAITVYKVGDAGIEWVFMPAEKEIKECLSKEPSH